MINLHAISDPYSKIVGLQSAADELAKHTDCKKAHRITMGLIRKAEMKLENAIGNGRKNAKPTNEGDLL